MPIQPDRVQAVLFDYGNTLIEFGPRQVELQSRRLAEALAAFGPVDADHLRAVRRRQLMAPFVNGYRENDERVVAAELLREIVGQEPIPDRIDAIVSARHEALLEAIVLPPGVRDLLDRLARRYRLGLVSNYPSGPPIRESLERIGLAAHFETVVISGDLGVVKPHPLPFRTALATLGVDPAQSVYVGDNWLADVQGAKRLGLGSIWSTQYVPYQRIDPQPGDHEPDHEIAHLDELSGLLPA